MVEKYNPKLKGFGSTNNPAIVGDGIVMIEKNWRGFSRYGSNPNSPNSFT